MSLPLETSPSESGAAWLTVEEVRGEVLLADSGRPDGWREGVGRAGYADQCSALLAHRLVGNSPNAVLLEIAGSCTLRVSGASVWVALVGGNEPARLTDGKIGAAGAAWLIPPDTAVAVPPSSTTYRRYLSCRGGLVASYILGSASRDTLAAIGPPPLQVGDVVPLNPPPAAPPWPITECVPVSGIAAGLPRVLQVTAGPHADGVEGALLAGLWQVTGGNRVGIRLMTGTRARSSAPPISGRGDIASFPVFPGCIELTPSGELLALGVDAPLTGGYPVPLVIDDRDGLDQLGRCRPGDVVQLLLAR